jgi:FAD/FMN-containing dehydrogenase
VSAILKYCNERRLAVVPQGGNTGLVGGSVPVFDEIILNLRGMNKIEKFDPVSSVVSVEAGVILEKLSDFLEAEGFEMPLDLGAKGSCQVGGNASTNAGGKYVLKYGSFRSHILGLEAVLPSGEVLDLRSELVKDNTGYDLKQLLIGSEGTLGVITKLNIHCPKADKHKKIMVFKTDNYQTILDNLSTFKTLLGKHLNALEYMNAASYNAIIEHLHKPIF